MPHTPNPEATRQALATAGKHACFNDARADRRNAARPDAALTGFCACTLDRAVGTLDAATLRDAARSTLAANAAMHDALPAANAACSARLGE